MMITTREGPQLSRKTNRTNLVKSELGSVVYALYLKGRTNSQSMMRANHMPTHLEIKASLVVSLMIGGMP